MHVMTVIDFLITSNDKSYWTQYSQIEYFAIYLGGWRPLQQRTATNFLFFLSFFLICTFCEHAIVICSLSPHSGFTLQSRKQNRVTYIFFRELEN